MRFRCVHTAVKMSRHQLSRVDRVAQMSIQEEIIAKKKLEIIEKQKTAELAKQVRTFNCDMWFKWSKGTIKYVYNINDNLGSWVYDAP